MFTTTNRLPGMVGGRSAELLGDIVRLPIGVMVFVSGSQSEAVFLN